MRKKTYDVVFWSYISSSVDRAIPIMERLKKEGVRALLFYQDLDMSYNGSVIQEAMIKRYGLDVMTYGDVVGKKMLTLCLRKFAEMPLGEALRNKVRGLRNRLLWKLVDEKFIERLFDCLGHKLNIFDSIGKDQVKYPVGSHFIKMVADRRDIATIAIPHGVRVYYKERVDPQKILDFETIVVCNDEEKKDISRICTAGDDGILKIGDPRFDSGWKAELREVFRKKRPYGRPERNKRILYLLPAFETIQLSKDKDSALADMASIVSGLDNVELLVRPHPRWRLVGRIADIIKKNGVKDFTIIGDDPLITYVDTVDYVISPATSALFDFLPEEPGKVIIFDNVSGARNIRNIFRGKVDFFEDIASMRDFLRGRLASGGGVPLEHKYGNVEDFCNRCVANGQGLNTIIDRYVRLIKERLN